MDEMNELYYRDPYAKEFDAHLVTCIHQADHYETVLDDTAFYPEGGGQEADHGTLNGVQVYDVQNHDGIIIHYTKEPVVGEKIHGILDWDRRFMNMQLHSADHLFSGLVHRYFGYDNVGFSMSDHGVRMDFSGPLRNEDVMDLEMKANEAIWKNIPIEESFPDREQLEKMTYRSKKELTGKVRIITIPGYDVCACCGTHVAHTGEIGLIRIYSVEKYKSGVRVMMLAGKRALLEDRILCKENHAVSVLLSAEPQHTSKSVENILDQNAGMHRKITDLNKKLLLYKEKEYEEGSELAVDFEEDLDRTAMIRLADDLCSVRHIQTAAIMNKTEHGYAYVIMSHSIDLRTVIKNINAQLNGRGGGKPEAVQGSFQASEEFIRKVLEEQLRKK